MKMTTKTLRMSAMVGLALSVVTGTIATAQKKTVPDYKSTLNDLSINDSIINDPSINGPSIAGYFSVPSSGFTSQRSGSVSGGFTIPGYSGNESGTARFFAYSNRMFAPVNLPGNSVVTSFSCGGAHPKADGNIKFTLRRNNPQQANVDMVMVATDPARPGFQVVQSSSITSAKIDNSRYNYYIVAERVPLNGCSSHKCTVAVGFCRIRYVH